MIGTLTLLAIGLSLIGLLAVLLQRAGSVGGERLSQHSNDLLPGSPRFEERWKVIVERIFGREDWDFVLSQGSMELRRLFFCERKKIALCWLSEMRNQARAAMRFHVSRARKSRKLVALLELRLALDYFSIRLKCALIAFVLLLRGPVALRGMVGQASHLAEQLLGLHKVASQNETFASKTTTSQ
jgi:hypothetical protein